MKFSMNVILQVLTNVGQLLNFGGGIVPTKYQMLVGAILGGTTMIISGVAQFKNPDGTPAKEPYVAPKQ